ncbi:MAG: DNA-directed DNA polymerase [Candidatus Methanospirareceae archaeon]
MKKEGFLLDADYMTENGKPVVRLWCKSKEGEDFVILDYDFEPYFYVVVDSDKDILKAREEIGRIRVGSGDGVIGVKRIEDEERKLLGNPIPVLKVFAEHPKHVPLLREEIARKGFKVLEADVLYVIRYLVDKHLTFFDGVSAEGEQREYCGREAIVAEKIAYKRMEDLPKLRIVAFDCEMASPFGMPSAKKDPIIIIAVAYCEWNGEEEGEYKTELFVMREGDKEDEEVIRGFLNFIKEFQPDIIVGYNSDAFDWQYLRERAKRLKIPLDVGADGSEPQYDNKGVMPEVNIVGRLNVDLYKIAKRDLDSVKVKTLENVADYLGVMRKAERMSLTAKEIYECWNSKSALERERLYEYAKADVISTLGIALKMLPLQYELSKMIGYPLDEVTKMGRGRQVEAFLFLEASKAGELVPPKGGAAETYEGGFVLPPEKGLHENVVCLDFSSMYPSIMISFNISPDTFVDPKEAKTSEVFVAPEVNHAFRKEPEGFFKRILKDLRERRLRIKSEMKRYKKDTREYRVKDIQQQSIKILMNSFYGYTGWGAARFYKKECAEATTAWGRYFIRKAMRMAEDMGFHVIYSDTDSLFVKLREQPQDISPSLILAKAKALAENISKQLPLELEVEDFYKTIFFTGKKKRYAGVTADGEMIVRGLEVRRGDWCELAKEVQSKVLEYVLKEKSPEAAAKYVRKVIKELREGKIPLEKLTVYKTLTRRIDAYEAKQAHVVAATRAFSSNIVYEVGSKIPYVIIKGVGKMSERAFPVDIIERSEGNKIYVDGREYQIDSSYYIEHQVIPAVHRILQHFGYDTSYFENMEQRTLGYWLT